MAGDLMAKVNVMDDLMMAKVNVMGVHVASGTT